jgi:hypothetical protein
MYMDIQMISSRRRGRYFFSLDMVYYMGCREGGQD